MSNTDALLVELLQRQRKDVPTDKKLFLNDIQRICKNINGSIFEEGDCCLWEGYVTNLNKNKKGTYINFYFKNKKVALHRILYVNYIGELDKNHYIRYTCENKGICCNVNHLKRCEYRKSKTKTNNEPPDEPLDDDELTEETKGKLTIKF